jgi:hypothetical protein
MLPGRLVGLAIVITIEATALLGKPVLTAIALMVVVPETVKAPVYFALLVEGAEPVLV